MRLLKLRISVILGLWNEIYYKNIFAFFVGFLVVVESRSLKTKTTQAQHVQVTFSPNLDFTHGRQIGWNATFTKCPLAIDIKFTLNGHQVELHLQLNKKLDPHQLPVTISDENSTHLLASVSNVSCSWIKQIIKHFILQSWKFMLNSPFCLTMHIM